MSIVIALELYCDANTMSRRVDERWKGAYVITSRLVYTTDKKKGKINDQKNQT